MSAPTINKPFSNITVEPLSTTPMPPSTLHQRRNASKDIRPLCIVAANSTYKQRSRRYTTSSAKSRPSPEAKSAKSSGFRESFKSGAYRYFSDKSPIIAESVRAWWHKVPEKLKASVTPTTSPIMTEERLKFLAEEELREKHWNENIGTFKKGIIIDGKFVLLDDVVTGHPSL